MNKIKYSILLIIVLCISSNYGFANDVNDNSTEPVSVKSGAGSFSASILRPLTVHDINPTPLFNLFIPEFVKGATYDLSLVENDGTPNCQYTIRGEAGRSIYVRATSVIVKSDGTAINDDGRGVRINLSWKLKTTGTVFTWDGNGSTSHLMVTKNIPIIGLVGELLVYVYYNSLVVDADAESGLHTFDQSIEVSYNTF